MIVLIIVLMDDSRPATTRVIHRVGHDILFVICFVNCAFSFVICFVGFTFSASHRNVDSDGIYYV
jgi:hypothetical protein